MTLIEFVIGLKIVILSVLLLSAQVFAWLIPLWLRVDLYDLARARSYGVEAACQISKHWPRTFFRGQVLCDDGLGFYRAKIEFLPRQWTYTQSLQMKAKASL